MKTAQEWIDENRPFPGQSCYMVTHKDIEAIQKDAIASESMDLDAMWEKLVKERGSVEAAANFVASGKSMPPPEVSPSTAQSKLLNVGRLAKILQSHRERIDDLEKGRQITASQWLEHDDRLKALEQLRFTAKGSGIEVVPTEERFQQKEAQPTQKIELAPGFVLDWRQQPRVLGACLTWTGSHWVLSW